MSEELAMKARMEIQFRPVLALAHVSAETCLYASSHTWMRHLFPPLALRMQQSLIRQRCSDLRSTQVLCQASVTHFVKAEDALDHSKHLFDFGSHAGFAAVGRIDRLINAFAPNAESTPATSAPAATAGGHPLR
jgi:hypothetical protein